MTVAYRWQGRERFVLLDGRLRTLPQPQPPGGFSGRIALIGLGDPAPVLAPVGLAGLSQQPLAPVHGCASMASDGGVQLHWIRRARGGWYWPGPVEVPLGEQSEAWQIEFANGAATLARWTTASSALQIESAAWLGLQALAPTGHFAIRQIGTHAVSPPLLVPAPAVA